MTESQPSRKPAIHPSWSPVRLADVITPESGDFIVENLIFKGGLTLLSAREKAGKTTLVNLLIRKLYSGNDCTFLGLDVRPSTALFISEEGPLNWTNRRAEGEAPAELITILQPRGTNESYQTWSEFCEFVGASAREHEVDVLVFDTWAWMNPSESENNNTDVIRALKPVQELASSGLAVLLIHHQSKGGGIRGGTSLPAGSDMIIEMTRRSDPRYPGDEQISHDSDDRIRRFAISGRYPCPSTIVARWDGEDYEVVQDETIQHARTALRRGTLHEVITTYGPLPLSGIKEHWPSERVGIGSESTLKRDLRQLLDDGRIEIASASEGGGSDPHLYRSTAA